MKVVYTLWAKPHLENNDNFRFEHLSNFFNSLILSVNSMKEHYDDIHLYADSEALEIIKDILPQLPFKKIHNVLDHLNDLPTMLWAFPKLYVYGLQDKPFFHIDNDAFLWTPIYESVIKDYDIICQHFEDFKTHRQYYSGIKYFKKFQKYNIVPNEMFNNSQTQCPNAGIFGAMNDRGLMLFKELAENAQRVMDILLDKKNKDLLKILEDDWVIKKRNKFYLTQYINMFNEQCLANIHIEKHNLKTYSIGLKDGIHKFSHLVGLSKLDHALNEKIKNRVLEKRWKV
jgi:hypothetical protein